MKFSEEDNRYLEARKKISETYGPRELWSIADHWPLYCGISNLARYLSISRLLEETLEVPGHVAEFGSWRGSNLMWLTKLLKIHDPLGGKVVHCFESFEGLDTFTPEDGEATKDRGNYRGSLAELQEIMALYQLGDHVEIHKGLIQDTLPGLMEREPALTFSFVYCDTDLFEPTELILKHLHPRLAKGGMFVFDEWNFANWPGEGLAANQFMKEYGDFYEMRHVMNTRQPSLVLRKIRY